ncbi:UNVERIFIED_CONTAM: putative mitochondrial protein [Sesamum indicum]
MALEEFNAGIQETGLIPLPMQGNGILGTTAARTRGVYGRDWIEFLLMIDGLRGSLPHVIIALYRGLLTTSHLYCMGTGKVKLENIWQNTIVGVSMFAVTRKLRVLKPVFTEQRRKKGDLTLNVQLAKGILDEAQQLVSSDRQNEAFLQLEHCCRLVYAKAAKRRVARTILQINDENGTIHTEPEEIINEFVCYYQNLLGGNRRQTTLDIGFLRPWARHILPNEEAGHLILAFTPDDVKQAVFDITEDKAPRPDGYSSGFFKAAWPVVGQEVTKAVLEFFSTGKLLKQVNSTLLALIPKVHTPMTVGDFRPISCCNVLYKIIAKLLVQRLSVVLDKIISPYQGAFIPRRSIGDNILLGQELLAGYNQVSLPPCCNQVSQLGADVDSVRVFKMGLDRFAKWSGLRLNIQKSHLILSRSAQDRREQMLAVLGFQEGHLPMRYLGLPLLSSRLSISDCQPLLSKIDARITGWEGISLSYAGRVQIIKSVLSSLSLYWASAFILPKAVIKEVEKRLRTILWKGTSMTGYAKVAWKDICKPVEEGGLGIKDIGVLNRALMTKKLCDVIRCDRTSIWVEWLQHGRLRNNSIWTVGEQGGSWGWRKMLRLRSSIQPMVEILEMGEASIFGRIHGINLDPCFLDFHADRTYLGLKTPLSFLRSLTGANGTSPSSRIWNASKSHIHYLRFMEAMI